MNNSTWVPLFTQSPARLVTGDLDGNGKDEVVIDDPAGGSCTAPRRQASC